MLGVFAVALVALVLNSGMDLAGVAALVIALGFLAAAFVIVVLGVGWEGFRAGRDLFRKQPPRD